MKGFILFFIFSATLLSQLLSQSYSTIETQLRLQGVGDDLPDLTFTEFLADPIPLFIYRGGLSVGSFGMALNCPSETITIQGAEAIQLRADRILLDADNLITYSTISDFQFNHDSGSSANHGITIRNNGGNNNYWTFYTLNGNGNMSLTRNGIVVGTFAANGVYTSSDKNLKENIKPINQTLPQLLKLTPSEYNYKSSVGDKKSIGFIAQDVNKYFPELVLDEPMDDGKVVMQLNYAGFGVLAIKAIQEQQDQIASQQLKINSQDSRIEEQDQIIESMQSQMNDLLVRLNSLEGQVKR